eukprot:1216720-Prymnesium_polylepis.1
MPSERVGMRIREPRGSGSGARAVALVTSASIDRDLHAEPFAIIILNSDCLASHNTKRQLFHKNILLRAATTCRRDNACAGVRGAR